MSEIEPFAVSIKEAERLTGLCRTSIYLAVGRGELEAVKDLSKTKITYASIKRREASLPRVKFKRR